MQRNETRIYSSSANLLNKLGIVLVDLNEIPLSYPLFLWIKASLRKIQYLKSLKIFLKMPSSRFRLTNKWMGPISLPWSRKKNLTFTSNLHKWKGPFRHVSRFPFFSGCYLFYCLRETDIRWSLSALKAPTVPMWLVLPSFYGRGMPLSSPLGSPVWLSRLLKCFLS